MGNQWSSWRGFVPFATAGWLKRSIQTMLWYMFLRRRSPDEIGHNPLAAMAYIGIYGLLGLEIFTGFALNSMSWGGWWNVVFGWIFLLLPANDVRFAHHMIMWLLLGFLVHHIYSSVLMDTEERSGLLSSIVTGYKSIRATRENDGGRDRNILLGDDGAGVWLIHRLLAGYRFEPEIEILDGGTLGLGLVTYLSDTDRLLIVDAATTGTAAGLGRRLARTRRPGDPAAPRSPRTKPPFAICSPR